MQGNLRPRRNERKFDSYLRVCKRCDELFRASTNGCSIYDNCNMNNTRWLKNTKEKGGK